MIQFIFLILLAYYLPIIAESELDRIIPPEIKNDSFYQIIYKLSKTENIITILEIGSSSGEGSTESFVRGIQENPNKPHLFCMEISKPRFCALKKRYENVPAVHCYNVSSISLYDFPTEAEVTSFYHQTPNNLRQYGCECVLGWLRQDIDYVKNSNVPQNGILIIKEENNIETFDMVLIDGSEFTGSAEFKLIYGARFILLDDITTFKNYNNYQQLLSDPNYLLIMQDMHLRNGFAVFKKR